MPIPRLSLFVPNIAFDQINKPNLRWLTDFAVRCENKGVGAIWVMDHIYWQTSTVEQIITIASIAAATSKINIGSMVLQLPLRHNSIIILAKQLSDIYDIAGERLTLGLGLGTVEGEYQIMGTDFTKRAKLFDSDLNLLAKIFDNGFHLNRSNNEIYFEEKQFSNIPLWLGNRGGDRALQRVVKYADGWMPLFIGLNELNFAKEKINFMINQDFSNRKPIKYGVTLLINNGDDFQISANAKRFSSLFGIPYEHFSKYVISGNLKQCANQIQTFIDSGLEHISTFWPTTDPIDDFLEIQSLLNFN